jgi:hypothetical protein
MLKFEDITVVTMKITVFFDVTLCSLVDMYQHFEGDCCLRLHGSRVELQCLLNLMFTIVIFCSIFLCWLFDDAVIIKVL